jgi:hypothetical protein
MNTPFKGTGGLAYWDCGVNGTALDSTSCSSTDVHMDNDSRSSSSVEGRKGQHREGPPTAARRFEGVVVLTFAKEDHSDLGSGAGREVGRAKRDIK